MKSVMPCEEKLKLRSHITIYYLILEVVTKAGYTLYIKAQIDIQPLIDVQSSNPCPISTSQTSMSFF